MYIEIDQAVEAVGPVLREVDDFTAFKVVIRHPAPEFSLAHALTGLGTVTDDGHAYLEIGAVRALAGERADDAAWTAGFAAMVAYAARSGWLSDDGQAIRAHCEMPATGA